VGGALDRRWLTNNGELVQQFERSLAESLEVEHCVAVANGTLGLQLALRAAGVEGAVAMPAFTFVASAHAAAWIGLWPSFLDVDPQTHNLDPAELEAASGSEIAAVLGVHLWGRPCDVEALSERADRAGVPLLFDAAHAFGCSLGNRPLGGFGLAEIFSFHATKSLSSMEGGAITTADESLARELRLLRNFGFSGYDRVETLGINAKMSEASAAFGIASLEAFPETRNRNEEIWRTYREALDQVPGIDLVEYKHGRSNFQYVVAVMNPREYGLERDELMRVLHAENVLARRYFFPGVHRMEPYASRSQPFLPVTDLLCRHVLVLPSGGGLAVSDAKRVCDLIRIAAADPQAVLRLLHAREGEGSRAGDGGSAGAEPVAATPVCGASDASTR
jgi:dTDP-4-amino-4,6-dideoxygalactose transaminase